MKSHNLLVLVTLMPVFKKVQLPSLFAFTTLFICIKESQSLLPITPCTEPQTLSSDYLFNSPACKGAFTHCLGLSQM